MYVTIEHNGKSYVKRIEDVTLDEHVTGVFQEIVTACNVARKMARQGGLEYIKRKQVKEI